MNSVRTMDGCLCENRLFLIRTVGEVRQVDIPPCLLPLHSAILHEITVEVVSAVHSTDGWRFFNGVSMRLR